MAAAPAWRAVLLQRVVGAEEHVRDVHDRLVALDAFFSYPLVASRTEMAQMGPGELRARLRLKFDAMMASLRTATRSLTSAIVYMEAAYILAMHGGNDVNRPWEPLPTFYHLGQHHAAVMAALTNLKTSQEMAKSANYDVQWSRGHLSMATALVLDPAIPNLHARLREEYNTAAVAVRSAIQVTQTALAQATIARQTLLTP